MRSACTNLIIESTPKKSQIDAEQRLHILNKKS